MDQLQLTKQADHNLYPYHLWDSPVDLTLCWVLMLMTFSFIYTYFSTFKYPGLVGGKRVGVVDMLCFRSNTQLTVIELIILLGLN